MFADVFRHLDSRRGFCSCDNLQAKGGGDDASKASDGAGTWLPQ